MTCAGEAAPVRPGRGRELVVLASLLLATGGGYLWGLRTRGYGNAFYAAAVQAGTKSWKAFFFGSLDSGNLITVDKPPASLWVMELSGRLFGFGTWSMFVPQVLMAVAAVAALYAAVGRVSGPVAALVAGALLALTPVVFSMFRFNDPDALLMLLLTVAGYTTVRAIQTGRTRWLLLTGVAVGFAFLTKELQAFLAVPGLGLAYLWAAPTSLGRRIAALLGAGAALVVAAGWWVLAVALWPTADRPYLGGSTDNSELGRAFGYNGLGRILGGRGNNLGAAATTETSPLIRAGKATLGTPALGSRAGGRVPVVSDPPGIARLLHQPLSGYVSWLLPAALILLVAGLWFTRRAPRTDLTRAALLMFGGWLAPAGLVLSLMAGIFHEYYSLVLAPPIVGLVAVGGTVAWRRRRSLPGRLLLVGVVAVTTVWSWALLVRYPNFPPPAASAVLALGLALALAPLLTVVRGRWASALVAAAVVAAVVVPLGAATGALALRQAGITAAAQTNATPQGRSGQHGLGVDGRSGPHGVFRPAARGSLRSLEAMLAAARTRWSAATIGSSATATFELASDTAVMAVGGYTGNDPVPTLARFQADVRAGEVRYFLAGGPLPGRGVSVVSILSWVRRHFLHRTVDQWAVYDLRAARPADRPAHTRRVTAVSRRGVTRARPVARPARASGRR